jgi:DNA-directed RNA polymerase beta subunit
MSSTTLNGRISFGKTKTLAETPDLLDIQLQSFKDFFQLETTPDKRNNEGLFKVFKENFPIQIHVTFSYWSSWIILLILRAIQLKSVWNVD